MAQSVFTMTVDAKGIARVVFDYPGEKINKITLQVLDELEALLENARVNPNIKAMTISSAKDGIFIAGADLHSFEGFFRDHALGAKAIEAGHRVFRKLETLPFPTIAVINGACLGGGLELALGCTFRIVGDHPKASIGLPETSIGLFPGWGGTQRLPRLVGLMEGLNLILSGKPVPAKRAFAIHLVDAIYAWQFLDRGVEAFLEQCLSPEGRKKIIDRRKRRGLYAFLLEGNFIGRALLFWQSKRSVLQKTKGHYPAHLAALDVVKRGNALPLEQGLKLERDTFVKAFEGDFSKAHHLIQLFFTGEAIKKDAGLPSKQAKAAPVHAVGVLGAGTMGSGIAWLMSYKDIPVRMKDINWEAVGKGMAAAWSTYSTLMKIRKVTPKQANRKFHQIAGNTDFTGFHKVDLVVEAAVEDLTLKHKLLRELENEIRPDAIVATNTSSLTLKELYPAMRHPERLVGMHFFNPVSRMPLVEVVAGEKTTPEAVATAVEFCKRVGKTPIVVGDCSGFLVNRVFVRGFEEIMRLLEQGVPMERLDKAFVKFGLPMAPFILADEIGNDVNFKVFKSFEKAYGERMAVPKILETIVEHKLYGKKVGKGFYIHKGKKAEPNPQIAEFLGKGRKEVSLSDEQLVERAMLAMINEAAACLDEKIVTNPAYLDLALVYGVGFPPFRGGILAYADTLGIGHVVTRLKELQKEFGERFAPSQRLVDMDKQGRTFYS